MQRLLQAVSVCREGLQARAAQDRQPQGQGGALTDSTPQLFKVCGDQVVAQLIPPRDCKSTARQETSMLVAGSMALGVAAQ